MSQVSDIHGRIQERVDAIDKTLYPPGETALICLGDVGFNFYLNHSDTKRKQFAQDSGYIFYCVRGNHEERPQNIPNMTEYFDMDIHNFVYMEEEFSNIKYFRDGEEYKFNGHSTLVIGGAYSVDKWYRLLRAGYTEKEALHADPKKCGWFKYEQLTIEEMRVIENKYKGNNYDFVFTHTCPLSWEPVDLFLSGIDQSKIDKSMEEWLDSFKNKINWKVWLFAHFHSNRIERPHCEMLFQYIEDLETIWNRWNNEKTFKQEWWLPKSPNFYFDDTPWTDEYK